MKDIRFAFFGTPELAVTVLEELQSAGLSPALVVTTPDKPQGRGMSLTPPPVKDWALKNGIDCMQPQKLTPEWIAALGNTEWDVFVVAAYGKLLPQSLLDIPRRGVLNVHPSLLPKYRGPSPIRSAILADDRDVGVSIMLLDADMDHGPIIAQSHVELDGWPPRASLLEDVLAHEGGALLARVLPEWVARNITAEEQDHSRATFCKKITKDDGLVDLISGDAHTNLLKVRGLEGWPGAFTYFERAGKRIRVSITDAHITDGKLVLDRVVPEGKREMPHADFVRSGAIPAPIDL